MAFDNVTNPQNIGMSIRSIAAGNLTKKKQTTKKHKKQKQTNSKKTKQVKITIIYHSFSFILPTPRKLDGRCDCAESWCVLVGSPASAEGIGGHCVSAAIAAPSLRYVI